MKLLKTKKVAVSPGVDFGKNGEGYIQISYSVPYKEFKIGIERIVEFLEERQVRK